MEEKYKAPNAVGAAIKTSGALEIRLGMIRRDHAKKIKTRRKATIFPGQSINQ
jgi:hypothetical protein